MKRLLSLLALTIATPAFAETIAIVNGKVATIARAEPIENGTVLIRDGRIVSVGSNVAVPADARVVDAAGGWVEVKDGLKEGERIVVAGQHKLKDGTTVRLGAAGGQQTK